MIEVRDREAIPRRASVSWRGVNWFFFTGPPLLSSPHDPIDYDIGEGVRTGGEERIRYNSAGACTSGINSILHTCTSRQVASASCHEELRLTFSGWGCYRLVVSDIYRYVPAMNSLSRPTVKQ